ncbi:sugar transferase [Haemophilus paracuniculus]|uniref:Sugar transferase n=1 Tax=Haemophilus paracuniculus TaxID=734 RepID=A0A1T0AU31_9PAST|nr:sugar transferase [Haemophilus paracuniculus]OOR99855.1 sugar transferase [Haemophilus paracuniculus]
MLKRLFDIIVSSIALVTLLPIYAILTYLVKKRLGSPVLFRQTRPGLNGKPFEMIKFRTMRDAIDEKGEPLPDSERLTPFGKKLRATSLDELPELWNVLKGDMSLVGPRPLLMEYLPLYNEEQAKRHLVRPGITGYAQVNGRNAISWEEKFKLDAWYVENQTFWLDIKILFKTVKKVIIKDGISAENDATMPKFTGNQSK